MKTTAAEPFELVTPPASGGGPAAEPATARSAGQVDVLDLVEPDVLGRDAAAALAFVVARRRRQDLEAAEEMRGICHWADLHRVTPGRESEDGAVDPEAWVAIDAAAELAERHGHAPGALPTSVVASVAGELGTEGELRLAGQGCFMVTEFAITHLATELRLSEAATRALVGQSLELRDRLPRLWGQVMVGLLPAWKGRQIAKHTIPLTADAAAYVDAHVAPFAHQLSVGRILKAVDAAVLHHDPDRAALLAEAAAEQRGVWIDHGATGPADMLVGSGTSTISATVDTPDAVAFEDAVAALAASLGELGHTGSLDVRRAKAVGVLADPQHAIDLTAAANQTTSSNGSASGDPMRPQARTRKRLGGTTIHIHLHTAAIAGDGTGDRGGMGPIGPVARVEQYGPRPAAVVQQWLADLAPGAKVTVTPVVDLADRIGVDAYEAPQRLRDQLHHLDTSCVFPWCGRQGRYDLDHIEEYQPLDEGGPPGQTDTMNLGRLCRYHHRVKTYTVWVYRREPDRSLTWTSPLGKRYRVDHTGTTRIPTQF